MTGQILAGLDLSAAMRSGAAARAGGGAAYSQITRCYNCTEAYNTDPTTYQHGCGHDSVDSQYTVPCALTPSSHFDWMGMSVRTDNWRYTIVRAALLTALPPPPQSELTVVGLGVGVLGLGVCSGANGKARS